MVLILRQNTESRKHVIKQSARVIRKNRQDKDDAKVRWKKHAAPKNLRSIEGNSLQNGPALELRYSLPISNKDTYSKTKAS